MKNQDNKNIGDLRRQRNHELLRRMRTGESLTSFDSKASWYPPRPIIAKDKAEMARLYQQQEAPQAAVETPKGPRGKVVHLTASAGDGKGLRDPYGEAS